MINVCIAGRAIGGTSSAIEVSGHSANSELCNAISILMKYLELGISYLTNDCRVVKPVEGIFNIYFQQTAETEILVDTFIKTVKWLNDKYPVEINILEV